MPAGVFGDRCCFSHRSQRVTAGARVGCLTEFSEVDAGASLPPQLTDDADLSRVACNDSVGRIVAFGETGAAPAKPSRWDKMHIFLWSGMFLVFSISGSAVELAHLIGAPISPGTQLVLATLAAFVAASGIALVLLAPSEPALVPHKPAK